MRLEELRGIRRAKGPRNSIPGPLPTGIRTFSGWAYTASVTDVFSRRVVGWLLSTRLHTDLALDALEMGIWTRQRGGRDLSQLIQHSDRGMYRAIRYAEPVAEAEAEAVASVGSQGDSYDNVMTRCSRPN
jgi:putative transposase